MTPKFHALTVKNIRKETDDTVSIAFAIPTELKNDYVFKAGQYLTLKATIDGADVRRSYSLCSAPFEEEHRVAIKQIENGVFSTFANQSLKEGDVLDVMTPSGNFALVPNQSAQKSYVLIAAGSGVTPILSIAKTILNEEPNSAVTLFYGNKGFASIIFREEIEGLKNKFMDRLTVVHILSRENPGNRIQKGRIDEEKLGELFTAFIKDIANVDDLYVCGPESMILAVKSFFGNKGMDAKNIHFELFATSTPVQAVKKENEKPSFESAVKVIIDGDVLEMSMPSEGESILDAAYKAGGDLPFACKGGVCCTCKAKIMEGSAKMDVNYALEPDEVEAGYILTCQAHPTSETLTISFDE